MKITIFIFFSIISKIEGNKTKCNRYGYELVDTYNVFFQVNEIGEISIVSSFPPAANFALRAIAECNFERKEVQINVRVKKFEGIEVKLNRGHSIQISENNIKNYLLAGKCSKQCLL